MPLQIGSLLHTWVVGEEAVENNLVYVQPSTESTEDHFHRLMLLKSFLLNTPPIHTLIRRASSFLWAVPACWALPDLFIRRENIFVWSEQWSTQVNLASNRSHSWILMRRIGHKAWMLSLSSPTLLHIYPLALCSFQMAFSQSTKRAFSDSKDKYLD